MVLLLRLFLIGFIIYLVLKGFRQMMEEPYEEPRKSEPEKSNSKKVKGVPKEIGEYVDYEEVD